MRIACAGLESNVIIYIDNIVIHAESIKKHNEILCKVIQKLSYANLTLNLKKCKFLQNSLDVLGHTISHNKLQLNRLRIASIQDWPAPQTKKQLQRILGVLNFFSKFCLLYSKYSTSLYQALKKTTFQWTNELESCLEAIKRQLVNAPDLIKLNPEKKIYVAVDSSFYGMGACCFQISESNKKEFVAIASRSLSDGETNYPIRKLELAAISFTLLKFNFLFSLQF
jgi:hypothetical protein